MNEGEFVIKLMTNDIYLHTHPCGHKPYSMFCTLLGIVNISVASIDNNLVVMLELGRQWKDVITCLRQLPLLRSIRFVSMVFTPC